MKAKNTRTSSGQAGQTCVHSIILNDLTHQEPNNQNISKEIHLK